MFQFVLDGALFQLRAKDPHCEPLLQLPRRIEAMYEFSLKRGSAPF